MGSVHHKWNGLMPRASKLSSCLTYLWRTLPSLERNFTADLIDSPLVGWHQVIAFTFCKEAMLVEKEKEVKNTPIFPQHNLSWSVKQRKSLASTVGCQVSSGQRFMYLRSLTPAVARGGHSWAEGKDVAGTQWHFHTGYHQQKQQLTGVLYQDFPLDHCA